MTNAEYAALLADAAGRFTHTGPLDAATLRFLPEVRAMCAEGKCRAYGHSWSCPPAVASLEEMAEKLLAAGARGMGISLDSLDAKKHNEFAGAMRRLEAVRKKSARSSENISAMKGNISQIDGKIAHVEAECSQLIELWEEKYPYDAGEASTTEGGRELTSSLRKLERELKSLGA